jgi:signal transduction histidine kinase
VSDERKISVEDDWKRNWQESIAVRISALVLWITIPVVVVAALVYLSSAEERLREAYADQADLLAFRVENAILFTTSLDNPRFRDSLRSIANAVGFRAVKIKIDDEEFLVGDFSPDLEPITRGIPAMLPSNPGVASTVQVTGYHEPLRAIASRQRDTTLVTIVIALTVFGLFLMWAIRVIVHRPLHALVDATRQVSAGKTDLRLDSSGNDEFSALARFFNRMLDGLMIQQKKVEHALDEAKQANRAKSVFLANMSHELRTPLNAIIGYSDMLAEEAMDIGQGDAIPDLQKIKTAGKHLLDVINNILDISKIEAGKMELYVEPINVGEMVRDIVATVQPLVERNRNKLSIDCPESIGTIRADVTKLRQALLNLISNAAKFTENGFVSLRVERLTSNEEETIRFSVSDTGIGMSEEQLRAAFQAFAQGDAAISRRYGGTGLGLAISRHYVSMMGGDVGVRSTPGKGTTFTIRMPVNCESGEQARTEPRAHRNVA